MKNVGVRSLVKVRLAGALAILVASGLGCSDGMSSESGAGGTGAPTTGGSGGVTSAGGAGSSGSPGSSGAPGVAGSGGTIGSSGAGGSGGTSASGSGGSSAPGGSGGASGSASGGASGTAGGAGRGGTSGAAPRAAARRAAARRAAAAKGAAQRVAPPVVPAALAAARRAPGRRWAGRPGTASPPRSTTTSSRRRRTRWSSSGLKAAGYQYVNIDEGWWQGTRDGAGNITVDTSRVAGRDAGHRGLHSRDRSEGGDLHRRREGRLRLLLPDGPAGRAGLGQRGALRAGLPAVLEWGFDFVKVDWCGGSKRASTRRPRIKASATPSRRRPRKPVGPWCCPFATGATRVPGTGRRACRPCGAPARTSSTTAIRPT